MSNVAVTVTAAVIDTTQEPAPVQGPDHPVKVEPAFVLAVRVTEVPDAYDSEQSVPHLIPAGVLRTVPVPAVTTVSVNGPLPPVVSNVAVTERATVIDTTHEPVPVQVPDQPAKVEPATGVAVKVTDVPETYASVQRGWPPAAGTAPEVAIGSPWDLLLDGNTLYIAMAGTHQIWSLDLATMATGPLVGSGAEGVANRPLMEAELAQPSGLALIGNTLYFADSESSSIRSADLDGDGGETALVAGGDAGLFEFGAIDGVGNTARFQHPLGVAAVDENTLLVADTYNSLIRRVTPATGVATTYLGDEPGWRDGHRPRFDEPGGIAVDGGTAYVADTNNHVIRVVDLATGATSTLVLEGIEAFEPPPGSEDYRGTVITLDPATASPGRGALILDISLPEGYAVNADAPSSLTLSPTTVVALDTAAGGDTADLTGTELPVGIPVVYTASGDLTADLTLVYCEAETPELCLIEQVRFEIPLTVEPRGAKRIALTYEVVLPDIAAGAPS